MVCLFLARHLISELSLMTALAVFTWIVLEPPLAALDQRSGLWIAEVYARNLVYLVVVASGLHLYFYRYRQQGSALKYESQFLSRDSNRFTFKKQLWDNVFWSIASGLTLWTAYEVLLLAAQARGWAPVHHWQDGAVWFVALFVIIVWWESFHFYWVHRFLHWPPL